MNREYFSQSTKNVLLHLKEYNFKLCRKGILERAIEMKIDIGEFKNAENVFLKNMFNASDDADMFEKFNEDKRKQIDIEINKLKVALTALDKTIVNIKNDVKSKIDKRIYGEWLNRIECMSKRFKILYSDVNNNLYNHFYKLSCERNATWNNLLSDVING